MRVVAAVVMDGGRVLLSRRPDGKHLGGYWEFPGGKVEAGEGLPEALTREMREELAVDVEVGTPLAVLRHTYPDQGEVELHFFRCRLVGGTPRALGCASWDWVPLDRLASYRLPPADTPVVQMLIANSTRRGE